MIALQNPASPEIQDLSDRLNAWSIGTRSDSDRGPSPRPSAPGPDRRGMVANAKSDFREALMFVTEDDAWAARPGPRSISSRRSRASSSVPMPSTDSADRGG